MVKSCSHCGEAKPLDGFGNDRRAPDGKRYWCKDCERRARRPDRQRVYEKRWRDAHPEARRARARAHYRRKPSYYRARDAERRALLRGATIEPIDPEALVKLLEDPCAYCGGEATEIDHIIPLAKGGAHALHNLAPSCMPCNRSKGARIIS